MCNSGERDHKGGVPVKGEEELTKLRILIPHWIEHNDEHAANFGRWAEAARAAGAESVAQHIEEAAAQMAACNQALAAALEAMGE